MDDRKRLENKFNQAMLRIYERAKKECKYTATRFFQMISEHGGLNTARILINAHNLSDGFTELWQRGRLDLTVEAEILKPEWKELFTDEQRKIARNRLKDLGYKCSDDQITKKQETGATLQKTRKSLKGKAASVYVHIGIWQEKDEIHIAVPMEKIFHVKVNDKNGSSDCHKKLFQPLKKLLIREGCWQ